MYHHLHLDTESFKLAVELLDCLVDHDQVQVRSQAYSVMDSLNAAPVGHDDEGVYHLLHDYEIEFLDRVAREALHTVSEAKVVAGEAYEDVLSLCYATGAALHSSQAA